MPNAECRYAECHYTECRYAECRGADEVTSLDRYKTGLEESARSMTKQVCYQQNGLF